MSSLSIPSSATAALPAVNIHPHGHEHKKGTQLDLSGDSSSSTAAQIPVGSAQNLFGSLFNSLAQLIGARPAPASGNPGAASAATAASAASASIASASSRI